MTTPSPCINSCCLDNEDVCLGCFRTIQEITQWTYLDDTEKQAVIEQTQQRKQAHEAKFGKWHKK